MGFRFRRSVKVAPGVKVNFNKRGISTTIGGKAFRVTSGSNGVSVGSSIPGTGIYYHKKITSRKKRPQRNRYEQLQREQIREEKREQAKLQVAQFDAHIEMLQSVHEEVNDTINWEALAQTPPPFITGEDGPFTKEALKELNNYKPSFFDKLFQQARKKEEELKENVNKARLADEESYNDWKEIKDLATLVLNGDRHAWAKAMKQANPFEDIEILGSNVKWTFSKEQPDVTVQVDIKHQNAVPRKTLSLTKTGKVSQRNMPKKKYLQLYQDYVSSCTLRIAREFFTILPLHRVKIHVYDQIEKDGLTDYGCILSVKISRLEIEQTVLEYIDCSDTIETFEHNMRFLKTKGFQLVEELE